MTRFSEVDIKVNSFGLILLGLVFFGLNTTTEMSMPQAVNDQI